MPYKEKILNLNGWQRLWVVATAIYLIASVIVAFNIVPTEKDIYKSWSSEIISWAITNDEKLKNYSPYSIRNSYSDMDDKELVEKMQKKYIKENVFHKFDFEIINKRYKSEMDGLSSRQVQTVGSILFLWLASSMLVYILGWSISWMRRGFKKA